MKSMVISLAVQLLFLLQCQMAVAFRREMPPANSKPQLAFWRCFEASISD